MLCDECDDSHQKIGDANECTLRPNVKKCGAGMFSNQTLGGKCSNCPRNTYSEVAEFAYTLACIPCPAHTAAPVGTKDKAECEYKFRPLQTNKTNSSGYCTGTDDRGVTIAPVTSAEDCLEFVRSGNAGVAAAALAAYAPSNETTDDFGPQSSFEQVQAAYKFERKPPKCKNEASDKVCATLSDEHCDDNLLGLHVFKIEMRRGNDTISLPAHEACRVRCGKCRSENSENLQVPPFGCVVEENSGGTQVVRMYTEETQKRYEGVFYTPVCQPHYCEEEDVLLEVVANATMKTPVPRCGYGQRARDQWREDEQRAYIVFYALTGGALALCICLGYCMSRNVEPRGKGPNCCGCSLPASCCMFPLPVHFFVWMGIVFRCTDCATDWAFFEINIKGKTFAESGFDGNLEHLQLAALIVCIIGTLFAPLDIISKHPYWKQGFLETVGCCGVQASRNVGTLIRVLVVAVEDLPQLVIFGLYVNTMGLFEQDFLSNVLTISSFTLSLGSLLWSLSDVISGLEKWNARGATAKNKILAARQGGVDAPRRYSTEVQLMIQGDKRLAVLADAAHAIPYDIGAKVYVKKKTVEYTGVVRWKGFNPQNDLLVVGVELFAPKGDTDGLIRRQRYTITAGAHFKCNTDSGIFVGPEHLNDIGEIDQGPKFKKEIEQQRVARQRSHQEHTENIKQLEEKVRLLKEQAERAEKVAEREKELADETERQLALEKVARQESKQTHQAVVQQSQEANRRQLLAKHNELTKVKQEAAQLQVTRKASKQNHEAKEQQAREANRQLLATKQLLIQARQDAANARATDLARATGATSYNEVFDAGAVYADTSEAVNYTGTDGGASAGPAAYNAVANAGAVHAYDTIDYEAMGGGSQPVANQGQGAYEAMGANNDVPANAHYYPAPTGTSAVFSETEFRAADEAQRQPQTRPLLHADGLPPARDYSEHVHAEDGANDLYGKMQQFATSGGEMAASGQIHHVNSMMSDDVDNSEPVPNAGFDDGYLDAPAASPNDDDEDGDGAHRKYTEVGGMMVERFATWDPDDQSATGRPDL